MGNIGAPCTKRNRPFPFLAKMKWQHHTQLQKESIQEGARGLSLPPQFSAAKSKLPPQKNRLPGTSRGSSRENLIPHLLVLAV